MYNIPVFIIPEAATIMAKGGCMISKNNIIIIKELTNIRLTDQ
jgi:hypothetical protein